MAGVYHWPPSVMRSMTARDIRFWESGLEWWLKQKNPNG